MFTVQLRINQRYQHGIQLPELMLQAGEFAICVCCCGCCRSSKSPGVLNSSLMPVTAALLRAWQPLCSLPPWLRPIRDIAPSTRLIASTTDVLIIWNIGESRVKLPVQNILGSGIYKNFFIKSKSRGLLERFEQEINRLEHRRSKSEDRKKKECNVELQQVFFLT